MKSFFLLLILVASNALAGITVVGNGGDVVDCGGPNIELLDVYELKTIVESSLSSTFTDSGTVAEKLDRLLTETTRSSPMRGALLRAQLDELSRNTVFVSDDLQDIPDSQHLVMPTGCKVSQIAIQKRIAGRSVLTIDTRLWERLDETNRAALMLHEAVYSEAIDRGHQNSIATRAITGLMLNNPGANLRLQRARIASGFSLELTLARGQTLLFPARYGAYLDLDRMTQGEYTGTVENVCGILLTNGKIFPCASPLTIKVVKGSIDSVSGYADEQRRESPRPFDGRPFGLPFALVSLSMTSPKVTAAAPVPVEFDGHRYECLPSAPIEYRTVGFTPGIGYAPDAKITRCLARSAAAVLPVRLTGKLDNIAWAYDTQFNYDSNGLPTGITFSIPKGQSAFWRLGFTFFDDLKFTSYSENWPTKTLTLKAPPNEKIGRVHILGRACLVDKNGVFTVEPDGGLRVLRADFPSNQMCMVSLHGDSVKLLSIDLDLASGKALRVYLLDEQILAFASGRAKFQGEVELQPNGSVHKGKLSEQVFENLWIDGTFKRVLLLREVTYEVVRGGVKIVDMHSIERDQQGRWKIWGRQKVSIQKSPGVSSNDVVEIWSKGILDPGMVLIEGTLNKRAMVPTCRFDQYTETVRVESLEAEKGAELKLRLPPSVDATPCYWVKAPPTSPPPY